MGYTTLIIRAVLLVCLVFSLINMIIYEYYREYRDSFIPNDEEHRRDFVPESLLWGFAGVIIIFALGTASSVCLILGVKNRNTSFLMPYLIIDTALMVGIIIAWFVSFKYFPYVFPATAAVGKLKL